MKLSELVALTMQLVNLNREQVDVNQVKLGYASTYNSDSHWSDIFHNVLSRLFNGFNELVAHDKMPLKTIECEVDEFGKVIIDSDKELFKIISVYRLYNDGSRHNYGYFNLNKDEIVLKDCRKTKVLVAYIPSVPILSWSIFANDNDIDLAEEFNLSNVQLMWVAKYAVAEIQEFIDEYKSYSNKSLVMQEIEYLPNVDTQPIQNKVKGWFE